MERSSGTIEWMDERGWWGNEVARWVLPVVIAAFLAVIITLFVLRAHSIPR